ncbi:MAG TPA: DUF2975 domain-containing protein [Gemmatimonadaceae bacterium]
MTQSRPYELDLSRKVVNFLTVANVLVGVGILALFIATIVAEDFAMKALIHEHGAAHSAESHALIIGMRWIMFLGILAVALIRVALNRLGAIVDTVRAGDPFILLNAERIKTIAWTILGLEVLHLIIGLIARSVSTETHPLNLDWNFNFMRWLVVLFLFVLARVFEQGARMREDLQGTV